MYLFLRTPRRLLLAEHQSRPLQVSLNRFSEWMRAAEHAACNPYGVFERRHGLAEIVERGAGVLVERPSVIHPHPKCGYIIIAENAPRHGHRFAEQRLGFFEAL